MDWIYCGTLLNSGLPTYNKINSSCHKVTVYISIVHQLIQCIQLKLNSASKMLEVSDELIHKYIPFLGMIWDTLYFMNTSMWWKPNLWSALTNLISGDIEFVGANWRSDNVAALNLSEQIKDRILIRLMYMFNF